MNIQSKFLCLILSAAPVFFQQVIANECSSVTFINETSSNKIAELVAINANLVNTTKVKSRKVINGESLPHYFESGEYSALVQIWDRSFYNVIKLNAAEQPEQARAVKAFKQNRQRNKAKNDDYFENEIILAEFIQEIPMDISIANNTSYSFGLNQSNNEIILSSKLEREVECPTSKRKIFGNKFSHKKVSDSLPEQLELRLRRVFDSLSKYHKAENLPATNLIPSGAYPYFGAILSNKKLSKEGYQIISVQPYSLAQKLGLITGDSLLKLGNKAVIGNYEESNDELQKYLSSVELKDLIELTVYRDGEEKLLTRPMSITSIPQSSYAISQSVKLENETIMLSRTIPDKLAFDYDQIMLELSEHYERALQYRNIELSREPSFSKKYGMRGKLLGSKDNYTFEVTDVEAELTANKMGIKTGDLIKTLDGKSIENKRWPFGKTVKALNEGQYHKVEIVRNGNEIVLEGKYIYHKWPAFTLKLLSPSKLASLTRGKRKMKSFSTNFHIKDYTYYKPTSKYSFASSKLGGGKKSGSTKPKGGQ